MSIASDVSAATPTVWLVRAGRRGRYAADFLAQQVVAIGWPAVGDLAGRDRANLVDAVRQQYGEKGAPGIAGILFRFANQMTIGDLVLTPDSETRELHGGRVVGDYRHDSDALLPDYPNVRPVQWTKRFSRDELPKRILYQLGSLLTLSTPTSQDPLRAFLLDQSLPVGGQDNDDDSGISEDEPNGVVDLYDELRAQTAELIRARVAELDGYQAQDLVAGIVRAMGYHTQVSPEGADGGVDIVASKDALGVEPPIIKVQVKARANTRSRADEVRALAGLVAPRDERGLFVSTGGFTRDAENDGRVTRITLVGMDRLVELLIEHYEQLDQDTKSLVPLRRLWVP
jgi:restriction system protein